VGTWERGKNERATSGKGRGGSFPKKQPSGIGIGKLTRMGLLGKHNPSKGHHRSQPSTPDGKSGGGESGVTRGGGDANNCTGLGPETGLLPGW